MTIPSNSPVVGGQTTVAPVAGTCHLRYGSCCGPYGSRKRLACTTCVLEDSVVACSLASGNKRVASSGDENRQIGRHLDPSFLLIAVITGSALSAPLANAALVRPRLDNLLPAPCRCLSITTFSLLIILFARRQDGPRPFASCFPARVRATSPPLRHRE